MGGRGARFSPGETVLDPLYGQVTLLEDARGRKLALVSLDLVGVGPELDIELRRAISKVTGVMPESVLINCSHTHSGPMTHWSRMASLELKSQAMLAYEQELTFRMQKVAGEALRQLSPAEIRWHEGVCDVGINRRRLVDGEVRMCPNPQGAYNHELTVLQINSNQGRALLFSHGCHPVIVYGHNWTGISAEWPGRARRFLRQALGESTHAQFFQGLAGDVRPRVFADLEAGVFRKSRPEDVDVAGQTAAQAVMTTLEQDKGQPLDLNLASVSGYAMLNCTPGDPLEAWQAQVEDPDELTRNNARFWVRRLEGGAAPNVHLPWSIGLVRLDNEHQIAWIAGEPLSQWLDLLRQALPGKRLLPLGYTGGSQGYLPRDHHLPEGGYEITRSRKMSNDGPGLFNPGLDQAMSRAFQSLQQQIDRS